MILRIGKVLLTATMAAYFLLVAGTNITDYHTNYQFVQHVLSMDTIPPDSQVQWRAVHSVPIYHLFYWVIMLWETAAGAYCAVGAARLAGSVGSQRAFEEARLTPLIGLWLGLLLWAFAFITVGGEWFMMWESSVWNGESAAFRMFAINAVAIIFLHFPDPAPRNGSHSP